MGVDLPEEADVPPEGHADRRDDQTGGGRTARPGRTEAETRSHEECYNDLRIADAKQQSVAAQRITAEEQAAADTWNGNVTESRWLWAEYQRRWPPEERRPVDTSNDPPGSWRGDGDRFLKVADNSRVEAACDLIADREREKITPALRAIESQDPDRHLIGFDDRRKGSDRIKDKVSRMMKELSFSLDEAIGYLPDAIRYTFEYRESRYTQGVWADITRLKDQGFELDKIKNTWSGEQYKGINSQWIEPDSGQRFEVQFHTRISFEAKQLTHNAYERLRTKQADAFEELVLEAFQKRLPKMFRFHQVPRIFPTTLRGKMANKVTYYAIINDLSSRERPAGVFRRIYFEVGGKRDEAFTTDLEWERSTSLVSAERGDLLNEFIEITEDEANQIVERIRAKVTGTSSA